MPPFALNDALIMKDCLVRVFGYKPGNTLYQENATSAEMIDFQSELKSTCLSRYWFIDRRVCHENYVMARLPGLSDDFRLDSPELWHTLTG